MYQNNKGFNLHLSQNLVKYNYAPVAQRIEQITSND